MSRESKTLFILNLILLFVGILAGFSIYLKYSIPDSLPISNQADVKQAIEDSQDTIVNTR